MATFTLTDLPRELTPDEAIYLTSLCSDAIRRWEHERIKPSHSCKKVHAGPTLVDKDGTRTHTHPPTCHDCGRALHRPPGLDDQTWLCPAALTILPAGKPDSAVECEEKR